MSIDNKNVAWKYLINKVYAEKELKIKKTEPDWQILLSRFWDELVISDKPEFQYIFKNIFI